MHHNQSETNEEPDYYEEGGRIVFTRAGHLRRGQCCGSGCRHCPFIPRWTRGATRSDRNRATPSANEIPATARR